MCAPHIINAVSQKLSRRDLFRATLLGGAAAAVATLPKATAQSVQTLTLGNLADLTHTTTPEIPMFPGFDGPTFDTLVTVEEDGFYGRRLNLSEHTGTHMDAPAHFISGGTTADRLALESFFAPLAVVDISEKAANDPDAQVTLDDLSAWEAEHGTLPEGAAVMMYSGWGERVGDPESFVNADAEGAMHFPGFAPEAAEFLVSERTVTGIGVDTLSLDYGLSGDFATHVTILGAGKWGLENVANLDTIPPVGATLIVGGLKFQDASGGPVRLLAAWG